MGGGESRRGTPTWVLSLISPFPILPIAFRRSTPSGCLIPLLSGRTIARQRPHPGRGLVGCTRRRLGQAPSNHLQTRKEAGIGNNYSLGRHAGLKARGGRSRQPDERLGKRARKQQDLSTISIGNSKTTSTFRLGKI